MEARITDVKRKHFDMIADLVWNDPTLKEKIDVYYTGSGIRGEITIKCRGCNREVFNKALEEATKIITEK